MNKLFGRKLDYVDWLLFSSWAAMAWAYWRNGIVWAFLLSLVIGGLVGSAMRFIIPKYPQLSKSSPYYLPVLIAVVMVVIVAFTKL